MTRQTQSESLRASDKSLLSQKETFDIINNSFSIKPRRTPAQQAQRDEFMKNATLARNWLNSIIWNAEKDNWSEVEYLLRFVSRTHDQMTAALPTDRAEPRGK